VSNLKEAASIISELLAGCNEGEERNVQQSTMKLSAVPSPTQWTTGILDRQ
jgi:hypothetical protein